MEKIVLSFVVDASFKSSVKGVTSSIWEIDSKIKLAAKQIKKFLDQKFNTSQASFSTDREQFRTINREIV